VSDALLETARVTKRYPVGGSARKGMVTALDDVTLDIRRGETLALVGESGSGKTTLGRCLLRLTKPTSGSVLFEGRDVAALTRSESRRFRRLVQPVFQNPYSSLDPRWSAARTIRESLDAFEIGTAADRRARVSSLLEAVGLTERHGTSRPHELSGGQRQRVALAAALAPEPALVVADEPVSALDVLVQAQILDLIAELQRVFGITLVFITHDLGVVAHLADRVAVMYLGRIVEAGSCADVLETPQHPYTQALVASVPEIDPAARKPPVLVGEIPSPIDPPRGCHFHTRCGVAEEQCRVEQPPLERLGGAERLVACHVRRREAAGSRSTPGESDKEGAHADG
jgi:oligopeptide/dipeptide ABC transporter ATP-binding protein